MKYINKTFETLKDGKVVRTGYNIELTRGELLFIENAVEFAVEKYQTSEFIPTKELVPRMTEVLNLLKQIDYVSKKSLINVSLNEQFTPKDEMSEYKKNKTNA